MPGVVRPLHVLWNEVIGFIFVVLALWAIPSAIRNMRQYEGSGESLFRVVLSFSFAGLMIYFGITSFLRAARSRGHEPGFERRAAWTISFHSRIYPDMYRGACGPCASTPDSEQRRKATSATAICFRRDHRSLGRLRFAYADGHRLRSSPGRGRSGTHRGLIVRWPICRRYSTIFVWKRSPLR